MSSLAQPRLAASPAALILCTLLSACGDDSASEPERTLARVGPRTITAAELVLAARPGFEESRAARLERAIGTALLAQEARERGIADEPEVRAQLALVRARAALEEDALLAQALFERERTGAAPSEAELSAHYEQTQGRYLVRMMRLRVAKLASRAAAEALHKKLGKSGRLDPANSEAVGPTEIQRLPREVLPEVLGLHAPGDRVVAGNALEGFSLVELVEYLPAAPRPFAEVREQVAREVSTTGALGAMEARAKELRAEAQVEIDEAALNDDAAFAELERAAETMRSRFEPARRRAHAEAQ